MNRISLLKDATVRSKISSDRIRIRIFRDSSKSNFYF